MTRQKRSLRRPAVDEDFTGFPRFALRPQRTLWRVVRDGHGPFWFSSSMQGRFDLPAPEGTCYLAGDDLTALLEVLGPGLLAGGLVPTSMLRGRCLRRLGVARALGLAHTRSRRAARWVTAEIASITPYAIPQLWARAFRRAGFEGVWYSARHVPSPRACAAALFGTAGEHTDWPPGRRVPISERHVARLRASCGIELFETPFEDELVFAPDPE